MPTTSEEFERARDGFHKAAKRLIDVIYKDSPDSAIHVAQSLHNTFQCILLARSEIENRRAAVVKNGE